MDNTLTQDETDLRFEEMTRDVALPVVAPYYAGLKYTAQWWETRRNG